VAKKKTKKTASASSSTGLEQHKHLVPLLLLLSITLAGVMLVFSTR
jgi:hypothetical protein